MSVDEICVTCGKATQMVFVPGGKDYRGHYDLKLDLEHMPVLKDVSG